MMTETLVNYRNLDVILDSNDLELIYTIKQFPIFMGCVDDDSVHDKFFDMNFCISKSSGIIQLNPIVSLEEVYRNSHGSGKIGKLWIEHNCEFSKFIKTKIMGFYQGFPFEGETYDYYIDFKSKTF